MLVVDLCGKLIDRCIVADIGLVDRGTGTGIPDGRSGFLCCGEFAVETREELFYDKDRLLEDGARWEREIARNLALDAPYR